MSLQPLAGRRPVNPRKSTMISSTRWRQHRSTSWSAPILITLSSSCSVTFAIFSVNFSSLKTTHTCEWTMYVIYLQPPPVSFINWNNQSLFLGLRASCLGFWLILHSTSVYAHPVTIQKSQKYYCIELNDELWRDCWNRPITGVASRTVKVLERETKDFNKTFR